MKWDDDSYKHEKWEIFDVLKNGLAKCHASQCSVFHVMHAIDNLFIELTEQPED